MRLYGKNPVLERLKNNPNSIKKLYLQKKTQLSEIVKEARKAKIYFESVEKDELSRFGANVNHQGVVAVINEYDYYPFPAILKLAKDTDAIPVFIDGVTDPQNLGSILRSLACLGSFVIIIPAHNSAEVNETVLRVACGGENYIKIAQIQNTVKGVLAAKDAGFKLAGAVAEDGEDMVKYNNEGPIAVVMGSEGKGIRPGILKHLDVRLSIPMRGARLSYNVSIATALFCYELVRERAKRG